MTVFIVERFGVYQQGVVGIFSTEEKAEEAIKVAKQNEPDDYHTFTIEELAVDNILNDFDNQTEKYGR